MATQRVEIVIDLNDQAAVQALNAFKTQFQQVSQDAQDQAKATQQQTNAHNQAVDRNIEAQNRKREQERREEKKHQQQMANGQTAMINQTDQANRRNAQIQKEQVQQQRLNMIQGVGRMITAGVSTGINMATSADASGIISAMSTGAGQGVNAFGGLLSNLGLQKTGSIVQTAGSLVPLIGQGISQAIGQLYSRYTEVAQYELPKMLAGYRFNDAFRAKEAPKIGGAYGYSMMESLNNMNAYASAFGTRNVDTVSTSRIFADMRSAEMMGVNPLAIPQFAALGGMGGAMQDESAMAGIARGVLQYASSKNMLGSQAEKLLGAINSGIQGMASKGLNVNAEKLTDFIIGVSNAGIKSVQGAGAVRAIQGIEAIAGQAKGGYLGNFQGLAMQALQAEAAATSDGSPLGMVTKLEQFQTDPRQATNLIKKRLGATVSKLALGGAGLSQAQVTALFGAGAGNLGTDFDLTGQIGDQLDVTKKLNKLERERVERNFDYTRTTEGQAQLDALLKIQQDLELIIENIATSTLSTKLIELANTISDYFKP